MSSDLAERLTTYLTDAHAIEEQALQQLQSTPDIAGEPGLAEVLRQHLVETEHHERRIRELLDARGASPSALKDIVMRAGGAGMVLFARAQADTPGKLAAHALAYEAFEWASYDLLARTAERAQEPRVADVARSIRHEERAMMERIEALFDATADASLQQASVTDLEGALLDYLAAAHAIEAQSIQLLESGLSMVEAPELKRAFRTHLSETRAQQGVLEARLAAHDSSRSLIKDAALRIGGFNWGLFFRAQPDTEAKLAGFVYAFEHLEIGGYEQLRRVAERAGDDATVDLAVRILAEERAAAGRIAAAFEEAVDAALAEQTVR
jgi:ferritin-like metal-binding protein YciE